MIDELVMNARDPNAYVTGPQPEKVRIEGITTEAVVAIYDPVGKKTAVGYFSNLRQSEEFGRMLGMVQADWGLDRLVVTLVGSLFGRTNSWPSSGFEREDLIYPLAALEQMGIPNSRIKERHLSCKVLGTVDIIFNMRTGKAQIRRQPVTRQDFEVPNPPEPDEGEIYDPLDPNEERFLRLR